MLIYILISLIVIAVLALIPTIKRIYLAKTNLNLGFSLVGGQGTIKLSNGRFLFNITNPDLIKTILVNKSLDFRISS